MPIMVYAIFVVGFFIVALVIGYALNRSRTGRDFSPGTIQPRVMFKGVQWTGDPESPEEVYDETHVTQSYDASLDMLDPKNPQHAEWMKEHEGDESGTT